MDDLAYRISFALFVGINLIGVGLVLLTLVTLWRVF